MKSTVKFFIIIISYLVSATLKIAISQNVINPFAELPSSVYYTNFDPIYFAHIPNLANEEILIYNVRFDEHKIPMDSIRLKIISFVKDKQIPSQLIFLNIFGEYDTIKYQYNNFDEITLIDLKSINYREIIEFKYLKKRVIRETSSFSLNDTLINIDEFEYDKEGMIVNKRNYEVDKHDQRFTEVSRNCDAIRETVTDYKNNSIELVYESSFLQIGETTRLFFLISSTIHCSVIIKYFENTNYIKSIEFEKSNGDNWIYQYIYDDKWRTVSVKQYEKLFNSRNFTDVPQYVFISENIIVYNSSH